MLKTNFFKIAISCFLLSFSKSIVGQCTANAGADFSTCATGAFNLSGSYSVANFDIEQNDASTCLALSWLGVNNLAQSFTATTNTICGAGVKFSTNVFGNVSIALYTGLPNFGGSVLAVGQVTVNHEAWADITWPEVSIVPGQVYYLIFNTHAPHPMKSDFPNEEACFAGSINNPYTGGICYATEGFGAFEDYDFAFRTHSCENDISIEWFGNNILNGGNSLNPTVDPPVGEHTYTMEITDNINGCSSSSSIMVVRESFSINVEAQGDLTISAGQAESYQWVTCPDFIAIVGENGASYIASETGSYAVIATGSNGCIDTSMCVSINLVGLEYWQDDNFVQIFPNPTNDMVTIHFNGSVAQVELFDINGRLLRGQEILNGQTLSMATESQGIYYLRLQAQSNYSVHKIIKQ